MSNMRLANVNNWSDICKSVSKTDATASDYVVLSWKYPTSQGESQGGLENDSLFVSC